MVPQFVEPYVKSNKNDRRDAEGIAEVVTRPTMRVSNGQAKKVHDGLTLLGQYLAAHAASHMPVPPCGRRRLVPSLGNLPAATQRRDSRNAVRITP